MLLSRALYTGAPEGLATLTPGWPAADAQQIIRYPRNSGTYFGRWDGVAERRELNG